MALDWIALRSRMGYSKRAIKAEDMDSLTMLSHLDLNSEGSMNFEDVLLWLAA